MKRVIVRKRRYPSQYPWEVHCPHCSDLRHGFRRWGSASTTARQAIATADRHSRTQHPKGPAVNKPQPPAPRYKLELTITGNTLDEIQGELDMIASSGFLMDHQNGARHEWECYGGTTTRRMTETNPDMTPERWTLELREWFDARRAAQKDQP